MSSSSKEGIWEETDAATNDSSDKGEILENEKSHQHSRPSSLNTNVKNFELTSICTELYELSLTGAAQKDKKDVISTMKEPLMRWLNGQIILNDVTSTCESDIDEMDGAACSPSPKSDSIVPRRWLVRFFVNSFKGTVNERLGIETDIHNAEFVFKEILSCEWESVIQRDKNKKEILTMLEELAKNWSLREYDGLICFFSSHGTEGHILFSDGQRLSISDICTSLNSIANPKLLFIQACQGSQKNPGIVSTSLKQISEKNPNSEIVLSSVNESLEILNISNWSTEVEQSDAISESLVTPMDHNFLIYFSTTSQYESFRNSKYGSIMFIFLFYEIIKAQVLNEDSDFIDLLTQVNEDMMNFTAAENNSKQMPVIVNTLTKRVKLLTRKVNSSTERKFFRKKLEEIVPHNYKGCVKWPSSF